VPRISFFFLIFISTIIGTIIGTVAGILLTVPSQYPTPSIYEGVVFMRAALLSSTISGSLLLIFIKFIGVKSHGF